MVRADPRFESREIAANDGARALEHLFTARGLHHDASETIGQKRWRECGVVAIAAELGDGLGWGDYPSDAQARDAKSFRESGGDEQLVVAPPECWGDGVAHFGASVNFVN